MVVCLSWRRLGKYSWLLYCSLILGILFVYSLLGTKTSERSSTRNIQQDLSVNNGHIPKSDSRMLTNRTKNFKRLHWIPAKSVSTRSKKITGIRSFHSFNYLNCYKNDFLSQRNLNKAQINFILNITITYFTYPNSS